jgi:hypothetical protein
MSKINDVLPGVSQWYVAHCKGLKEWQAAAALEEYLGLDVYLPELRRRFHGQVKRSPFFPGYLFRAGQSPQGCAEPYQRDAWRTAGGSIR